MPVTQLDEKAALVMIDLQKGIVAVAAAHGADEVVKHSAALAKAWRQRGLPVVAVHVNGRPKGRTQNTMPRLPPQEDFAEFVPELEIAPTDKIVTKQWIGAFTGSDLDAYLKKEGVTQVFFVGISTNVGVESSARSAYDLGYNVVFVSDAMTGRDPASHQHSLEKIFPSMGEIATTEEVLELLKK